LGGDSAGGNITCTVCLKLRDENGPKLALQMPADGVGRSLWCLEFSPSYLRERFSENEMAQLRIK
jgi:hypothetical protein